MGATRKSNEMNQKIAHTLLHELALQTTAIETWVAVWFNHTCALTIICGISNWILNTNKPIALPISNDVTTDPAHSNSNSLSLSLSCCLRLSMEWRSDKDIEDWHTTKKKSQANQNTCSQLAEWMLYFRWLMSVYTWHLRAFMCDCSRCSERKSNVVVSLNVVPRAVSKCRIKIKLKPLLNDT